MNRKLMIAPYSADVLTYSCFFKSYSLKSCCVCDTLTSQILFFWTLWCRCQGYTLDVSPGTVLASR